MVNCVVIVVILLVAITGNFRALRFASSADATSKTKAGGAMLQLWDDQALRLPATISPF